MSRPKRRYRRKSAQGNPAFTMPERYAKCPGCGDRGDAAHIAACTAAKLRPLSGLPVPPITVPLTLSLRETVLVVSLLSSERAAYPDGEDAALAGDIIARILLGLGGR
jgi:hypothetical protein